MSLWRLMWPWMRPRWGSLLGASTLALLTVLAGVGLLSVAGWFLTGAFLAGASAAFNLFGPSALIRGLSFLRIVSRWGERVVGHTATLGLLADIRTAVFARIALLSPAQLARYQEGDLVARLAGDIDLLDTLFLLVMAPLLTAVVGGALFSLLAGVYVPVLAWTIFAALMVAVCVVPFALARWARPPGDAAQQAAADARARVHDMMGAHVDIVAFSAQKATLQGFQEAVGQLAQSGDALAKLGATGQFLQQLMVGVCTIALLGMGYFAYQQEQLSGPVWVGLLLGGIGLFEVLSPLMRGAARMGATMAAAARLREVLASETDLVDAGDPLDFPTAGAIEMRGVSFGWPGEHGRDHVLRHAFLRVEPGQRLAVVGPSGSGKSTLLSLLMRIVDPGEGQILYGGRPLPQLALQDLHREFTLLSQRSPVFLGTVRSNLLLGNPQASDAQLWQALADAGLASFLRSVETGLETWVGESGRHLSLGQSRRLCLARAVLTGATVWILDEPTAGLDHAAQSRFFNDLERVAANKTVILATHAVNLLGPEYRIVTIENGQLVGLQN